MGKPYVLVVSKHCGSFAGHLEEYSPKYKTATLSNPKSISTQPIHREAFSTDLAMLLDKIILTDVVMVSFYKKGGK